MSAFFKEILNYKVFYYFTEKNHFLIKNWNISFYFAININNINVTNIFQWNEISSLQLCIWHNYWFLAEQIGGKSSNISPTFRLTVYFLRMRKKNGR